MEKIVRLLHCYIVKNVIPGDKPGIQAAFSGSRIKYGMTALLLLLVSLTLITNNPSPITTFAQQSPLQVQFSPNQVPLKTGEEKIIKVTLSGENQISGLDLKFQTSGSLNVTDFREVLETDTNLNPFEYKQVTESFSGSNPEASYILTVPGQRLPKVVTLYLKIKGSTTGEGKITLDYNKSQVINGSGNLLQISPNQNATYELNLAESSPNFIDPASLPPINYPASTAIVNLNLRLYGAGQNSNPGQKLKGTVVAVGRVGDSKYETLPQGIELAKNLDGTFSGTVAFPNFKDGTKFSLMLKVDKYLLKRVCNSDATETKPGGYDCTDPKLTIRQGENSFNLTGVSLLPGDLGLADGLLNSYDLSLVRNNLNKNTIEAVALADLNYDGKVDKTDFEIIQLVASNTGREADQ